MRVDASNTPQRQSAVAGGHPTVRHAVEFRDASWWHEDAAAVLRRHGAAFCGISHPTLPETFWPTAEFLYLRFHGKGPRLYDYAYSREELRDWAARAGASGVPEAYAFFNNDIHANAPRDAAVMQELLR